MRTGLSQADAQDDFDRALRRARWATLTEWLRGRSSSRNRLLVLGDVTIIIGAGARDAAVPIDHIVGSVEPTKCFDRHFRPTSQLPRTRFARIGADIYCGRGMDPVDLYQCDDQYYVLDGPPHRCRPCARSALGPGEHHQGPAKIAGRLSA